jgi:hypothetical protein
VVLQIQDNGNDLEEEGGDGFIEIDDMLLDELDLSGLLRRLNLLRQLLRRLNKSQRAQEEAATGNNERSPNQNWPGISSNMHR